MSPFRLYGEKLEKITVQEAGRRGGLSVLANRGREHFVAIGKKGQEALRERYPNMAKEWKKEADQEAKS